jgi:transcriptional regulator with GAF, ATPase, and Fis domain
MSQKDKIRNSRNLKELIDTMIPGTGEIYNVVRTQVYNFARIPSARSLLITGPVGCGKSTLARIIALSRYLFYLKDDIFKDFVSKLKFDGPFRIDKNILTFFEEFNLSCLVPELAQSQLFGIGHKVATQVSDRPGIFEQAMYGHGTKEKRTDAADVTGGIVFLDEVGDLPEFLQPLLLSVLTGTEIFRVGGEGMKNYAYTFEGTIITATWKDVSNMRKDLLSRLTNYVIKLPGLNERKSEFGEIVHAIVEDINLRNMKKLEDMKRHDILSKQKIVEMQNQSISIDDKALNALKEADWNTLNDLRGLTNILEKSLYDNVPVIKTLQQFQDGLREIKRGPDDFIHDIIDEAESNEDNKSLADIFGRIENKYRTKFSSLVKSDLELEIKISRNLGINKTELRKQINNLVRNRKRGGHEIN